MLNHIANWTLESSSERAESKFSSPNGCDLDRRGRCPSSLQSRTRDQVAAAGKIQTKQKPLRICSTNMTLVYCGSLASVHSHKPARPSRVSASCPTSLHCSFSGSSLQAPPCVRVANHFDCLCTSRSDLVALDQSSWKQPHRTTLGIAFLRARVPLHSVPTVPTRESAIRLSRVSVIAGRVSAEGQASFKVSGQKQPVNTPPSSSALLWAS